MDSLRLLGIGAALGSAAILTAGYTAVASTLLGPLRFDPNLTRLRDLAWLFAGVVVGAARVEISDEFLRPARPVHRHRRRIRGGDAREGARV